MNDKTLLIFASVTALLGLVALVVITSAFELPEQSIATVTCADLGKTIRFIGSISRVSQQENVAFLDIANTASIKVVSFETGYTITQNDTVEVVGRLEEYQDKLEVIADSIVPVAVSS